MAENLGLEPKWKQALSFPYSEVQVQYFLTVAGTKLQVLGSAQIWALLVFLPKPLAREQINPTEALSYSLLDWLLQRWVLANCLPPAPCLLPILKETEL